MTAGLDTSLLSELGELDDSGEGLLPRGLVEDYEMNRQKLVVDLRLGVQSGDLKKVEFAAHSLRSSSGGLGAKSAQLACEKLESYGREAWTIPHSEVEGMLSHVETETRLAWIALTEYVAIHHPANPPAA
ncbi:MAG: Hpt domain-containing protein [Cryobacterium sp.]|nr:Hpt domain-containing protein [Oligoflexia bacterium]